MKNRVIILEDNAERKKFFFRIFPDAKITDSKADFLEWVTEGFYVCFIDNDLGRKYTGLDIAREMPPSTEDRGSVCVHSANIVDNEKIAEVLHEKGYTVTVMPFGSLLNLLKLNKKEGGRR